MFVAAFFYRTILHVDAEENLLENNKKIHLNCVKIVYLIKEVKFEIFKNGIQIFEK